MPVRIGFYICHCGINIAGKVNVVEVANFASKLDNVVIARDYKFMCSDPGQEMIMKDIDELRLNRVVVASCSPRLHGKTFQGACRRAGLNPYFFQMASVREQVSWVTEDEQEATDKAKSLAAAAINRVNFHESLESREAAVHPDVMVVGGGIAGIQAALDIGDSGHHVYLVEKEPTIGGHMLQFDKTFPTLDCAACIGTPKMVEVAQNPNVELLAYSEVSEISGFIGAYNVKVVRKPRYIIEGKCTGCGECAKVCPVIAPSEWDEGLNERRAVYRSFPQAVPITYCIDKKKQAPCVSNCPAGVNVQGYVQLIGQGKYNEAIELIMNKLPLPGVLGRVCPHPCETACRRFDIDEAVAIRNLKRFAADHADISSLKSPEIKERPEKIAIIGSGPAGLTAAWFLRLKGYQVTIFEALDVLGGMLRTGIPDYRLPRQILQKEIDYIISQGVEVRTKTVFGKDVSLASLEKEGFKAVFLGIGAQAGLKLNIPGENDCGGVIDAVEFLRAVNLDREAPVGRKILIIGGGNVAVDAARAARRLGADVKIVYRRTHLEMPAYKEEIDGAAQEGVEIETLASPVRIIMENGRVAGLECIRNELGLPDAGGRRRPIPIEGSEFILPCDTVIPAIGQSVDAPWASDEKDLNWTSRNTVTVNPETMQAGLPHVFAAGDMVSGPATVIEAVAAARKAVDAMDAFLNGRDMEFFEEETAGGRPTDGEWAPIPENVLPETRVQSLHLDAGERIGSFTEVDLNFSEEEARREASRCLNCGGCSECLECVKVCEAAAIDHTMREEILDIKVGSIILATGFDLFDPTPLKQFGYGKFPNVFTSLEFERLNNATGPTGGRILTRNKDGQFTDPPQSAAIIHCVGSRDDNYHEYCSRVCCMYALKYAHLLHDKAGPQTRIHEFYIDMRCFGKGYEEFYRRCQEEGVNFVRGKPAEVTDKALTPEEEGKLIVIGEDTLLGRRYRLPVDMVILCAAVEARQDASSVARVFGISQGRDGFFLEEHPKLAPLSTASDGVFLAGTCQGPRDVPDTVAQASGAAVKALSLATLGKVEIEPTVSWIDPDICAGCQICIGLCPYSAIEFNHRLGISEVNEALCKGCGSCSGFCPSGAAKSRHFKNKQIFAEIDGIFDAIHAVGR